MKSIEINYLTSSGYETLYPQTSSDLVAYNSQTLTQVINQQNSEIAGLQGQVGDSEVGVTIPKVMEYHFGAGGANGMIPTNLLWEDNFAIPFKAYYLSFIFSGISITTNIGRLDLFDRGDSTGNYRLTLFEIPDYNVTLPSSIIVNAYIMGTTRIGDSKNVTIPIVDLGILAWINMSDYIWTGRGTRMTCKYQNDQYTFLNSWALEVDSGTLSYSSLDIRIYYYD